MDFERRRYSVIEKAHTPPDQPRRGVYKEMVPWHGTVMLKIIDSRGGLVLRVEMVPEAAKHISRQYLQGVLDKVDPI